VSREGRGGKEKREMEWKGKGEGLTVMKIFISGPAVQAHNSKTKNHRKVKIGINVPRAQVSGVPIFI